MRLSSNLSMERRGLEGNTLSQALRAVLVPGFCRSRECGMGLTCPGTRTGTELPSLGFVGHGTQD